MTRAPQAATETRARRCLKNAGLLACVHAGALARHAGVPVLGYHSVDGGGSHISIAPGMFKHQMECLREDGFTGMSLSMLMDRVLAGLPVERGTVVLTFDDGLRNFLELAVPILKQNGFRATNFVPAAFVGGRADWYPGYGLEPLPILGWSDLRGLEAEGMDIQSHGRTHVRLDTLTADAMRREAAGSRDELQEKLGKPVKLFCYPFGDVNGAFVAAVREAGYVAAVTVRQGLYRPGLHDPLRMKRQNLDYVSVRHRSTARLSIRACLRGTFADYVKLRSALRRRKPPGTVTPRQDG